MRCDKCKFYSFPSSECRIGPPVFVAGFQGGQFPVVTGGDWCGSYSTDHELVQAAAIRAERHKPGQLVFEGFIQKFVAGPMLTPDELAENESRAAEIVAKRRAQ